MPSQSILIGSMSSYYAYRGANPYLNFDGVDDYATIPFLGLCASTNGYIEFTATRNVSATGVRAIYSEGGSLTTSPFLRVEFSSASNSRLDIQIHDGTTYETKALIDLAGSFAGKLVRLQKNGANVYDLYVNNVKVATQTFTNTASGLIGSYIGCLGVGTNRLSFFWGAILTFKTSSGFTYINQGDQSSTTVLPSLPSGSNGTLYGGTGWKYVGIDGHFETVALFNTWLASTTLTGNVTVTVLEPLDVSSIVGSKDGYTITVVQGYSNKRISSSYRYNYNYNF